MRAIPPTEERLPGLHLLLDEGDGGIERFVVHRLHALLGQRACVLDLLLADLAEARIDGRVVGVGRPAVQHSARSELRAEGRILWIVLVLRLLLGVQMIEIAEELIWIIHEASLRHDDLAGDLGQHQLAARALRSILARY